jgi:hypothetical protein
MNNSSSILINYLETIITKDNLFYSMEEEDELIPKPDFRGFLDLTSRAWVNLDPVLWTM